MIYVFDTCSLYWIYIDSPISYRCRYITSRCQGNVHIAEISILEIVSALGKSVRQSAITVSEFEGANLKFLKDLAAGRLLVRRFFSSDFIPCRDLLTLIGMQSGRALRTQDAIVAYTAQKIAIENGKMVTLLTSDKKLASIVNDLALFKRRVQATYLPPA